jgi:hypothetical protein
LFHTRKEKKRKEKWSME